MMPEQPFRFHNAGRFISRGRGRHATRVIDSHELIFVAGGTLRMFEGERNFAVTAGERLLLFPGRRHGGLADYGNDLSFYWLHFTPRSRKGAGAVARLPQHAPTADADFVTAYWNMLLSEQERRAAAPNAPRPVLDALTAILLHEAAPAPGKPVSPSTRRLADAARRHIQLHYHEGLSTAVLAQTLRCHPDYLSRIYTETHGCTVGTAIRRMRIRKACALLEGSGLSVKEIAREVGYADAAYFRKQFARECATTPYRYRKLRAVQHINTE